MKMRCLLAVGPVLLGAALLGSADAAQASLVDHEHFQDQSSVVEDVCGLNVRIDDVVQGTFTLKLQGPDGLPYNLSQVREMTTYTNLDNARSVTFDLNAVIMDQRVTDNG